MTINAAALAGDSKGLELLAAITSKTTDVTAAGSTRVDHHNAEKTAREIALVEYLLAKGRISAATILSSLS